MFLFLIFFPTPGPEDHEPDAPKRPTWRDALTVVIVSVAHFVVVVVLSVVIVLFYPDRLQLWATILGLCAAILACTQYIPQLWTTWKLQHVMSLSIPMMLIQTPGSFVFAASLAIRLGPAGWSAWGVYIVTGVLQGGLLAMGIAFEIRDRKRKKENEAILARESEEPAGQSSETTPLLRDST